VYTDTLTGTHNDGENDQFHNLLQYSLRSTGGEKNIKDRRVLITMTQRHLACNVQYAIIRSKSSKVVKFVINRQRVHAISFINLINVAS